MGAGGSDMVRPMNYILDVANPLQMALGGYDAAMRQSQQRQEMDFATAEEERTQQMHPLRMQAAQMQVQQARQQMAQAAAQQEAAARGQAAMGRLIELGPNATSEDYLIALGQNPEYKTQLSEVFNTFSEQRKQGELDFGKRLFAAINANPDVARQMIEQRREAAENAGDRQTADTMRSFEMLLDMPEGDQILRATVGTSLAGAMGGSNFKATMDVLGIGGGADEATTAFQTLDQRARAAGLTPGTPEYQRFMLEGGPQVGLSLTVGPDGSIQVSQGPGVTGTGTGTGVSQIGGLGQGEALVEGEDGLEIVPIPGGAADQARQQALQQELGRQAQRERAGSTVIQDLQRALDLIPELGVIARGEGVLGGVTRQTQARVPGTVANRITQFTESALSNVGLDTLQQMRENSPTGGALGQVPIQQQTRLEQVLGSLKIDQPPDVLDANIKRVMNIYTDIIYGSAQERAAAVEAGRMTPEESARISGFYFDLPFDERGRSISRPGQAVVPSPEAIQLLRNDPSIERQQQFDEIFGPGSAARIMEGGR